VDTGSTDQTLSIARSLAERHGWMRVLELEDAGASDEPNAESRPARIVRAFEEGLSLLDAEPEVIVKLDCDVSFEPDYFERLLSGFAADSTLGIARGSALELDRGEWKRRFNTGSSVWGAARAYRRECLAAVRPLERRMGWDGIDELTAQLHGWRTTTLHEISFRHHRPEGAMYGSRWRAWAARGQASHYMGYRVSYLLFRSLHHARTQPAAVAMVWGYASAALRRSAVHPDREVRVLLRRDQRMRNLRLRGREAGGVSGR
jgi:glycosyltransferase involved in cell wall biosynthesis